ncbi:MAG: hydantoinase/oxoprolinase family protein [Candidatus Heimdallarchaeota archaeon]|nr:hydantoinase/oxoprolinase family protein [Candidatus Heimdallarchaeota archaeon]
MYAYLVIRTFVLEGANNSYLNQLPGNLLAIILSIKAKFLTMKLSVGIDIGGTFTDIILQDMATGKILNQLKISTTPKHPEQAIKKALEQEFSTEELHAIQKVYHATTIATNAFLGQINLELPKTLLITTRGFRDVLEIGRQRRPSLYDFFFERPTPIIPRQFRLEMTERIDAKGDILTPIKKEELEPIKKFIEQNGVQSIAVSFLHSYVNPLHEQQVKRILEKEYPELFISIGSEVSPEHREFERTSTTAINAILMPLISRYVRSLTGIFQAFDLEVPLFIMQSNGGVSTADQVQKFPVSIIESGPSAGVVASRFFADFFSLPRVLSFDMGGTTAKAGTVLNQTISLTTEYEVGGDVHSGRITKGSGYPARFPFIDLAEISSGGGSIAWVDEGKALKVGPISAGADPGPACYGLGGTNPTITDANLILGRLNPKGLLNETFPIYPQLAKESIQEKITNPLDLSVIESALGIIKIANLNMSRILRIVTVERGLDPRTFTLLAFGGAGPLHACSLAEELDVKRIIVPANPGLFSALGLLYTNVKHTFVKSIRAKLQTLTPQTFQQEFATLEAKGTKILKEEGFTPSAITHQHFADLRYFGQGFELLVDLSNISFSGKESLTQIQEDFNAKHRSVYGYDLPDEAIEVVNLRINSLGIIKNPSLQKIPQGSKNPPSESLVTHRPVFFEQFQEFRDIPIYTRAKLLAGNVLSGPLIIEQYDTTTVVSPSWKVLVDDFGVLKLAKD